ncbi:MAG: hypothetical protein LBL05_07595 [Synergistaceae bacterium]|nr:hypothetical protein [Synergistaceae bacterium]
MKKFVVCQLIILSLIFFYSDARGAEKWIDSRADGFSGGDGSADSPYLISDASQLALMSYLVNEDHARFASGNYVLVSDIDLSGREWTPIAHIYNYPISEMASLRFNGSFDGGGHSISGLTVRGEDNTHLGLFGAIDRGGQVRNVVLRNAHVNDSLGGRMAGTLAGESSGTIENCAADGYVEIGGSHAGGLIGSNIYGVVRDCRADCITSGDHGIGGLIGSNRGTVSNCVTSGRVIGRYLIGGLASENVSTGEIIDCASSADLHGGPENEYVGSLVGQNEAKISPMPENEGATGAHEPTLLDLIGPFLKPGF